MTRNAGSKGSRSAVFPRCIHCDCAPSRGQVHPPPCASRAAKYLAKLEVGSGLQLHDVPKLRCARSILHFEASRQSPRITLRLRFLEFLQFRTSLRLACVLARALGFRVPTRATCTRRTRILTSRRRTEDSAGSGSEGATAQRAPKQQSIIPPKLQTITTNIHPTSACPNQGRCYHQFESASVSIERIRLQAAS